MARPFAQNYDVIYADKNYDNDIEVFEALAGATPLIDKKVIEIGAGTGNHTLRLALKVGELVSIETDADFAEILRVKLDGSAQQNIAFYDRPVENLPEMGFDAAVAFFHVVNYIGQQQLASFLSSLADRLKPGAYFVADLWNGAAAMIDPPREETRHKTVGDKYVTQHILPTVDAARRTVTLNYDIDIGGEGEIDKLTERIELYLWQREELVSALEQAGFSNVTFWDYKLFPQQPRPDSWRLWLRAIRD